MMDNSEKIKKRLNIADDCPCHLCITLPTCIDKPLSMLMDNCPILSEWVMIKVKE